MDKYLEQIIQISDLEIMEYKLETRRELSNRNRVFPFYVMSYLQKGEAVLELNGKSYETGPGSIVIIPENVRHSHYKTDRKPTTFLWWHFRFRIQYAVDALRLLNFPVVSYLKDREEFLLERAKLLLKNSEMAIGEIAEQTGFENIAAFTHFFTQRTGISPSGFRKTGSMF